MDWITFEATLKWLWHLHFPCCPNFSASGVARDSGASATMYALYIDKKEEDDVESERPVQMREYYRDK